MGENTEKDYEKAFEKIFNNYNYMNRMIVEEMEIASEHTCLTGNHRELMWMDLFRRIIPKKYSISQGVMIIDSEGHISKEVDIAVYDDGYTPYIFQYNTLKFIPIEAVAVVIECKSKDYNKDKLIDWAKSIEMLIPKDSGIARMVGGHTLGITNQTQKKTNPIKILASIKTLNKKDAIEKNKEELGNYFDFIILEKEKEKNNKGLEIYIKNIDMKLGWWSNVLNMGASRQSAKDNKLHIFKISKNKENKVQEFNREDYMELKFDNDNCLINTLEDLEVKDNPLLSLNFQLNQLLMLINNPMMFPHFAYAQKFNEIAEKIKDNNDNKECK